MPEPAGSYYSRIFTDGYGGYAKQAMVDLARCLRDTEERRGPRQRAIPGLMPSGYVYFAQFVNHAISFDATKLSQAGEVPPEATRNYRTARLDLEILYGNGVSKKGYLNLGSTIGTLNDS